MKIENFIELIIILFWNIIKGIMFTYINYILINEGFFYAMVFNSLVLLILSVINRGDD